MATSLSVWGRNPWHPSLTGFSTQPNTSVFPLDSPTSPAWEILNFPTLKSPASQQTLSQDMTHSLHHRGNRNHKKGTPQHSPTTPETSHPRAVSPPSLLLKRKHQDANLHPLVLVLPITSSFSSTSASLPFQLVALMAQRLHLALYHVIAKFFHQELGPLPVGCKQKFEMH